MSSGSSLVGLSSTTHRAQDALPEFTTRIRPARLDVTMPRGAGAEQEKKPDAGLEAEPMTRVKLLSVIELCGGVWISLGKWGQTCLKLLESNPWRNMVVTFNRDNHRGRRDGWIQERAIAATLSSSTCLASNSATPSALTICTQCSVNCFANRYRYAISLRIVAMYLMNRPSRAIIPVKKSCYPLTCMSCTRLIGVDVSARRFDG